MSDGISLSPVGEPREFEPWYYILIDGKKVEGLVEGLALFSDAASFAPLKLDPPWVRELGNAPVVGDWMMTVPTIEGGRVAFMPCSMVDCRMALSNHAEDFRALASAIDRGEESCAREIAESIVYALDPEHHQ